MAAQTPDFNPIEAASKTNDRTNVRFATGGPCREFDQTITAASASLHSVQRSEVLTSNGRSEAIAGSADNAPNGHQSLFDQAVEVRASAARAALADAKRDIHAAHERHLCQIGSDLHDGPAQLLALALLNLEALVPADPEATAVIQEVINHALREIRDISVGLVLPELDRRTASASIRLAVDTYERRTDMTVTLDDARLPADLNLSKALKICLYRLVQEGLQNSFKHAHGAAQTVTVGLLPPTENSQLTLVAKVCDCRPVTCITTGNISDHHMWRRTDGTSSGLGLAGLKERIGALDGTFEINSMAGSTELVARFALPTNTNC